MYEHGNEQARGWLAKATPEGVLTSQTPDWELAGGGGTPGSPTGRTVPPPGLRPAPLPPPPPIQQPHTCAHLRQPVSASLPTQACTQAFKHT